MAGCVDSIGRWTDMNDLFSLDQAQDMLLTCSMVRLKPGIMEGSIFQAAPKPLVSPLELRTFESLSPNERLKFLVEITRLHPSQEEAQRGVTQLFAHPLLSPEAIPNKTEGAWLRYEWLRVVAQTAESGPAPWAHALLDQGADPGLAYPSLEAASLGGGQILREALDFRQHHDPRLLERLWEGTPPQAMIAVLHQRVQKDGFYGPNERYRHHVDCISVRYFNLPELADRLAQLRSLATGPLESNFPLFAAHRLADMRAKAAQVSTPDRAKRGQRSRT
jgi:hypothetical protein